MSSSFREMVGLPPKKDTYRNMAEKIKELEEQLAKAKKVNGEKDVDFQMKAEMMKLELDHTQKKLTESERKKNYLETDLKRSESRFSVEIRYKENTYKAHEDTRSYYKRLLKKCQDERTTSLSERDELEGENKKLVKETEMRWKEYNKQDNGEVKIWQPSEFSRKKVESAENRARAAEERQKEGEALLQSRMALLEEENDTANKKIEELRQKIQDTKDSNDSTIERAKERATTAEKALAESDAKWDRLLKESKESHSGSAARGGKVHCANYKLLYQNATSEHQKIEGTLKTVQKDLREAETKIRNQKEEINRLTKRETQACEQRDEQKQKSLQYQQDLQRAQQRSSASGWWLDFFAFGYFSRNTGNQQTINMLTDDVKQFKAERDTLQARLSVSRSELERLTQSEMELTAEKNAYMKKINGFSCREQELACVIEQLKSEKALLEKKTQSVIDRFGQVMSDKSSQDEMKKENLNVESRPLVIKDGYKKLCGSMVKVRKQMGLSLKKSGYTQDEVDEFNQTAVCSLVYFSYLRMEMLHTEFWEKLQSIITQPAKWWAEEKRKEEQSSYRFGHYNDQKKETNGNVSIHTSTIDEDVHRQLNHYFRNRKDVNFECLAYGIKQTVLDEMTRASQLGRSAPQTVKSVLLESELVHQLVTSSCELAWQMTLQQPAMSLNQNGVDQPHDETTQDLFYHLKCDPTDTRAVVHYYLQPTLLQADKLIMKGVVTLRVDSSDYEKQSITRRK